jgi:carboxypeptidase T
MVHQPLRRAFVVLAIVPCLLAGTPSFADAAAGASSDFPAGDHGYHTYAEMVTEIHAVAAAHPRIVRLFTIGQSYRGRALWAAEVSDHVGVNEGEPEVLIDGLHHGAEHMSAEMPLVLLHWLADGYASNAAVKRMVDHRRIWIVFMVNPDGGEFDIRGGRYHEWRKNRQPTPGSTAIGTDVNRNYGYKWGCCGGSSANPSNSRYRGPKAFSTPEARAIRDLVRSRVVGGRQRITVNISFHTLGRLVLYPFGYTTEPTPPDMPPLDHRVFVTLARAMAARNGYTPEQGSALGITDGSEGSWLYGRQHIFAFVFEMTNVSNPPDEQIGPETERNRAAIFYLIAHAKCPYAVVGHAEKCRA